MEAALILYLGFSCIAMSKEQLELELTN